MTSTNAPETFFYSVLSDTCSCRDELGDLRKIGHLYKYYYAGITQGEDPIIMLNTMKMSRMCCRARFLSIPIVPMIDRSKNRVIDHFSNVNQDTTPIYPKRELDFPVVHDKQFRPPSRKINIDSKFKVVPPDVDVKGSLPDGF